MFIGRAQLSGRQFGVPCAYFAYSYSPFEPIENCTYAFVHGGCWHFTYRIDEAMVTWPYYRALDAFEARSDRFVPYWAERPPARAVPHELVKVSVYTKTGAALVMVANFDEDAPAVSGPVVLDMDRLGLVAPTARDAFSKAAAPLVDGTTLAVSIKSFRQAWFVLEEAGRPAAGKEDPP